MGTLSPFFQMYGMINVLAEKAFPLKEKITLFSEWFPKGFRFAGWSYICLSNLSTFRFMVAIHASYSFSSERFLVLRSVRSVLLSAFLSSAGLSASVSLMQPAGMRSFTAFMTFSPNEGSSEGSWRCASHIRSSSFSQLVFVCLRFVACVLLRPLLLEPTTLFEFRK